MEQLLGSLKSHEQRRLRHSNDQSIESAFQSKLSFKNKKFSKRRNDRDDQQRRWKTFEPQKRGYSTSKDRKLFCKICNKNNHVTAECLHRGKPKCNHCCKFGHEEKDCRFKNSNQANFAEKNDAKEEVLFFAGLSNLMIEVTSCIMIVAAAIM